jgi:hypothetical protein
MNLLYGLLVMLVLVAGNLAQVRIWGLLFMLLGPLQAIDGILMIGVSTAVLMAAVGNVIRKTAGVDED